MTTKHYHLMQSFPGCLPESNVVYEEAHEAIAAADEMANEYRDSGDFEQVIGEEGSGFYEVVKTKEYGSGFMIEVIECDMPDCLEQQQQQQELEE